MKIRTEFKKDAYEAAKLCVDNGLMDVVIAFDYAIEPGDPVDAPGRSKVRFFHLHASDIVQGVDKGDLPL